MRNLSRRSVLRGVLGGGVVTVALPMLDFFLNNNGTAFASGAPMPVRFGTWGYGLGMTENIFVPKKYGTGYDLPEEIESWAPVRDHINLFTNSAAFPDDSPVPCHYTGWVIGRTGVAPKDGQTMPGETIDVTVANQVGSTTRFKSLTATATADVRSTYSYENATTPLAPEWSPLKFYERLFGPEFPNPNAESFTPDPQVMVRKSVLSGVMDQTKSLMKQVGAEDRQRLDQYFTGLRQLENQFAQRLKKPEPIAGCRPGQAPAADPPMDKTAESVALRHRMMTELLVMAVACDQTRVINMVYSGAASVVIKPGYEKPAHTTTHEEPVDKKLGYQPNASWFTRRTMECWAEFVDAFAQVKEGDGTLLDNMLIYATTDHGYARMHTLDRMPVFTAGRAGGKVKTGMHIDMNGGPLTQIGYTAMRVMGVDTPSWGTKSNRVSESISEILV